MFNEEIMPLRSQKNQDIFDVSLETEYNIYVEDLGKNKLYQRLFSKILNLDEKKIAIYCLGGKIEVIKKYEKGIISESKAKSYFLLDKDYDNLYPIFVQRSRLRGYSFQELKSKNDIIILNKHSIENYFVESECLKEAFDNLNPEVDQVDFDKEIIFLEKRLRILSIYFYLNECYHLGIGLKTSEIYDYSKKKLKIREYSKKIKDKICKAISEDKWKIVKKSLNLIITKNEIRGHTIFDIILSRLNQKTKDRSIYFYNCVKYKKYKNNDEFEFIREKMIR